MNNIAEQFNQLKALVLAYGGKVALALVVLIIGLWLIKRFCSWVGTRLENSMPDETLAKFLSAALNIILKVLLVISVASIIGIETTSFIAVLGAASLAVGLALQGSLSNFAGGVMILIFRPFKVGDYIETEGLEGVVTEIGIFVTTLQTFDKKILIIPNGPIANGAVVNHTECDVRAVEVTVGVAYDDNLADAKTALESVLKNDARILQDEGNVVAVVDLNHSSVDFLVRAFVKTDDYWSYFFDARAEYKAALEAAGCTIPFQQTDIHLIPQQD